MDIIQTVRDKKLLGQFIEDLRTWRAWLCFLRAFFALRPTRGDRKIFEECTGRSQWSREASKEAWLIVGTRAGKSFISALVATFLAVFRKHRLSPGEKGYIIIVSPTKKQSGIIKGYLSTFFQDNEFLKPYLVRETTEEVELSNRVVIAIISSDYKSLRGFTGLACIIDEVAFLGVESESSRSDTEVVRALRSRLINTKGPLICISSPYAKRGELYKIHKRHYGKDGSRILVWQAPSLTMNPTLDQTAIDQALAEDFEGARADYLAEFRSDIESFVTREAVEACVVPGRYEILPIHGVRYSAFVDPSGGSKDSMTLAISHEEKGKKVLDCIREATPPFSPDQVVEDFSILLLRYALRYVTGDRYAGEWPRERFRVYGITYQPAEKTKSDIYKDFLPLLNSGEVELLDHPKLVNQIINLERRTARGGRDSIDHPPGGHDDLANVVAGCLAGKRPLRRAGVWGSEYEHGLIPLGQVANAGLLIRKRDLERDQRRGQDRPFWSRVSVKRIG
jgi:hypothetical protein